MSIFESCYGANLSPESISTAQSGLWRFSPSGKNTKSQKHRAKTQLILSPSGINKRFTFLEFCYIAPLPQFITLCTTIPEFTPTKGSSSRDLMVD